MQILRIIIISLFVIVSSTPLAYSIDSKNYYNAIKSRENSDRELDRIEEYNIKMAQIERNKANAYLFFELYDNFCKKYGYEIKSSSYIEYIKPEVNVTSSSNASDSDYDRFYYSMKSDIKNGYSQMSSTTKNYLNDIVNNRTYSTEVSGGGIITHYYYVIIPKGKFSAYKAEVYNKYLAQKDKVSPKKYSVENEVSKYSNLTWNNVVFILSGIEARINFNNFELPSYVYNYRIDLPDKSSVRYLKDNPNGLMEYSKELDRRLF